ENPKPKKNLIIYLSQTVQNICKIQIHRKYGSKHIYRTHTCPVCRRCFKMRSHLQEHLHLHFPDPGLQCPTCQRYFTSKSKLRVHRLREAGEKLHRCHLCEYSAVERNSVRRHLASVHAAEAEGGADTRSFLCPTCGESFQQSRALKAHMKTHNVVSADKPLTCFQPGCRFQTSLRKELIKHVYDMHGVKAVECRHHACGAVFQSEADMEAHYRSHLAYHCSECDFSCSNKSVFLQHQRLGHPGSERLCCDFCSFVTFNPVEFEQHVGHLHASEKIHRCPQCSFVTGEKPHKCSVCDFRCRDESYLSKHMLTHSDDKNYMCAECGYVTKWKHYLNVHMRKHAGDLRYTCDQCPYRCHRMDQLNSHKLRHQDKSLMCEICAYACKRKYELRNHMLAKHSGEQKQPAVFKCKYCSYATCYRQALQNHENCKHTKLREFRCALCTYSSFSSISLFLHKRKAHGYVPGDKEWLENYAARERERNSSELTQDFYVKPSVCHEPTRGPASAPDAPGERSASTDHECVEEPSAGSQPVASVDIFDVVSQEVVKEAASVSPSSVSSPEEYCTLVLTALPAPSLPSEEAHSESTLTLSSNATETLQEKTDFASAAGSSGNDGAAEPDGDSEQSDCEPLSCASGDNPTQTSELDNPTAENQPSQSEIRLKAMKKHDKDQADAMVLEGRVQMLVLPTEGAFRCDRCSYVACKESALKQHRRASCHGRSKRLQCQACGAQFRQKRGLDSHLKKKCPALLKNTRNFVGVSDTCLTSKEDSALTQEGSEHLDGGTSSDQTSPSSQNPISADIERENATCTSPSPNSSGGVNEPLVTDSEQEQGQCQTKKLLKRSQEKCLYTKKDGKFQCKRCSFSAVKLLILKRHLSTCRGALRDDGQTISEEDHEERDEPDKEVVAGEVRGGLLERPGKHRPFRCLNCAFRCNQKRALESHERKGCMQPGEVQCSFCTFVGKSRSSLSRHILYTHRRDRFGAAKARRLQCQHCAFSCRQDRRLVQHVALKHRGSRPHRCRYCPFATARRYRLEQHESLHTGVGRHGCDVCHKTFGAAAKLRQHKMRIHDKRPTQPCSLCDFSSYTLDDVRRHKLRCHTGELRHVCSHCDAKFSSEVALRNHCRRVHLLQAGLSCKQCDYTCSSEFALKAHQHSVHTPAKCSTCQESFQTKETLELHQKSHRAHQCPLCPFAAKARQRLAQHLLGEHEEGSPEEKPLKCSSCPFVCRHQLVLEQHLRSHGSRRLYKCADCEYSTRNKQKITWHIRIHTGEKPYSCEQCSYSCTDPARLKLHMRVHQEEKKYLCPQCGYKCKWATQLKYHMTKHTGEKPYACDDCDYRTNRADALRAHRDTQHCDARPYVCEKCGKAFKTSFILKTHQRQHGDDRPYACGLCQKAFRWPAGLRHHFLSHTKQQPFRCRLCSYSAKQKFQVVKHLQRHHPDTAAEQGVVRDAAAGSLTLKEALQGTLGEGVPHELPGATEGEEVTAQV
uniref:Zinc finger protein 142 n=1 Tax=Salarias fasciatus TaxID=181472 RepID=A0A672HW96_SALFA